jgi:hypothetical protein
MNKFKLKSLIIIFFILMLIEFLIGLTDVLLFRVNNESSLITTTLIEIFSLPISLINKDLPFYVSEEFYMIALYWTLNVLIQAMFVYVILKVFRRLKNRK